MAPVLVSDAYALTPGPAWEQFLIRVPERDIARLPAILEPRLDSAAERGRLAREAFDEFFSIDREFDRIIELAAAIVAAFAAARRVFPQAADGDVPPI